MLTFLSTHLFFNVYYGGGTVKWQSLKLFLSTCDYKSGVDKDTIWGVLFTWSPRGPWLLLQTWWRDIKTDLWALWEGAKLCWRTASPCIESWSEITFFRTIYSVCIPCKEVWTVRLKADLVEKQPRLLLLNKVFVWRKMITCSSVLSCKDVMWWELYCCCFLFFILKVFWFSPYVTSKIQSYD